MHVEDLTIKQLMLAKFDALVERARTRSPKNVGFFELARDYARRHVDAVARFGRFPHRNGPAAYRRRGGVPRPTATVVDHEDAGEPRSPVGRVPR